MQDLRSNSSRTSPSIAPWSRREWTQLGALAALALIAAVGGQLFQDAATRRLGLLATLSLALLATWAGGLRYGGFTWLVGWCGYVVTGSRDWSAAAGSDLAALCLGGAVLWWLAGQRRRCLEDRQQARRDPLTHLPNRQTFADQLDVEMSRAARFGRPFAVAVLDCDGFKELNDRLGHLAGDEALRDIARILRDETRRYDTVARLGGDEFVLLLSEAQRADAELVIERVRTAFAFAVERKFPGLTCSIGVAVFRRPPADAAACLRCADEAMYAAKRQGRSGTVVSETGETSTPSEPLATR